MIKTYLKHCMIDKFINSIFDGLFTTFDIMPELVVGRKYRIIEFTVKTLIGKGILNDVVYLGYFDGHRFESGTYSSPWATTVPIIEYLTLSSRYDLTLTLIYE